jgi:aminoglycoside phosphotransferase (APT) family kinase protein
MTSTPSHAEQFTGTMPVREPHRFDEAALARYLRGSVEGFDGAVEVSQFRGGQSNPTFLVRAGGRPYVVRCKPFGQLLSSAHAVDREYRVLTALARTDVPVPRTYAMCEDASILGTPFYVMDYVEGRIFWEPSLPGLSAGERSHIYDAMNDVIARLHEVDPAAVGLSDYGKPGNYFARQIARWSRQYLASETKPIEAMHRLMEWLPQNVPAEEETAIVHGDYRIDNIVFHPHEPVVLAVLDWELSTLGHPLADFSYHCMKWRLAAESGRGLAGIDFASTGIPTEREYVSAYRLRTGRERVEHWDFCLAYNMFRLAAILQGIAGRVEQGTAASAHAVQTAALARPMAEEGWRVVERIEDSASRPLPSRAERGL